jgi:Flp pilus assembly pilin Flp
LNWSNEGKKYMKLNWNVARAKKHLLGRILCRMAGDEKGAVMMEYVIVAVLIAAACVTAVAMFGRTIVGMFSTAAKGATGDSAGAKTTQTAVRDDQSKDAKAAGDYHDSLHTGTAAGSATKTE